MLAVKGIYRNGKVELLESIENIEEANLYIIVLPTKKTDIVYKWEWDDEEEKKFNESIHLFHMSKLDEEYGEENREEWS